MGDRVRLDQERTDLVNALDEIRAGQQVQEVVLPEEDVIAGAQLGRDEQRDRTGLRVAEPQEVPQGHEVDMVVGVHVADRDGRDARRIAMLEQRAQGTLPEVEDDRCVASLDQVRG